MIEITKVSSEEFPVVDFKFQNRGRATALLHAFTIRFVQKTLDDRPSLLHFATLGSSEPGLEERSFVLRTRNDGWGPACSCALQLGAAEFRRAFRASSLRFNGSIASGEELGTITLTASDILPRELGRLATQGGSVQFQMPTVSSCIAGNDGQLVEDEAYIHSERLPGDFGTLELRTAGFVWREHRVLACIMEPTARYFSAIEPEDGSEQKRYSISHSIAAGDVERFQIVLGARKSCRLRLRFEFEVDSRRTLRSDEFDVRIWAPRNSSLRRKGLRYRDGDRLLPKMEGESPSQDAPRDVQAGFPWSVARALERTGA